MFALAWSDEYFGELEFVPVVGWALVVASVVPEDAAFGGAVPVAVQVDGGTVGSFVEPPTAFLVSSTVSASFVVIGVTG